MLKLDTYTFFHCVCSASESASEKSSEGFLVGSCCFLPSYAECLTNMLKCLILLPFDIYAVRASGGEG